MKIIRFCLSENFHFLVVKFSVCLNRHVFDILCCSSCVRASVLLYVEFVVLVFVPHRLFFHCFGRTALRDCAISWVNARIFW